MKKLISWMITFGIITGITWWINPNFFDTLGFSRNDSGRILAAWENRESNLLVESEGRVLLELPYLAEYGNLQRFLIELENGHRILISHNLDVASMVPINVNSEVRFKGEYDYTFDGGMVHWTHRDLNGQREGGWIEHMGKRYQ